MHVKKGDNVIIISGKDKGKSGKIIKALPKEDRVVVENANMKTKHQKARRGSEKGQTIQFAAPMHVSNVKHADAIKKEKAAKK